MKIVIAGSRNLEKKQKVVYHCIKYALAMLQFEPIEIVSGTAVGVDKWGEWYAKQHGINIKRFPADWTKHGRAAGPIRNNEMADYCDAGIVIINNESTGSNHMFSALVERAKPTYLIKLTNCKLTEHGKY